LQHPQAVNINQRRHTRQVSSPEAWPGPPTHGAAGQNCHPRSVQQLRVAWQCLACNPAFTTMLSFVLSCCWSADLNMSLMASSWRSSFTWRSAFARAKVGSLLSLITASVSRHRTREANLLSSHSWSNVSTGQDHITTGRSKHHAV